MTRRWRLLLTLALACTLAVPPATAATVAWPPSPDLVVGEVVTGGASGSDEYVELFNAGAGSVSLAGLELVYASASGKSVSRKHAWDGGQISAGGRVLLANASGVFAAQADATYSGGFSANGGSLALREAGGAVIDALSWGSAASEFVEGTAGAAPAPGSSLERRPGGGKGNGRDTNDNAADTVINASPLPEGSRGAQPTPKPTPKPTPEATPKPTPEPTPEATPKPTPAPTPDPTPRPTPAPTPTPTPTATPTPAVTPAPTLEPTPEPEPTATPSPIPSPVATPTPIPTSVVSPEPSPPQTIAISEARGRPVGSRVAVSGTITVQTGRILGDRTLVLQDHSGGIAVRLPAGFAGAALPRGTIVWVEGELAAPYGNLEVRPAAPADLGVVGAGGLPEPATLDTGGLSEANEGLLATMTATVAGLDRYDSGATTISVRDASGQGRIYAFSTVALDGLALATGQRLRATGIVGQRASSSGAADGHRLWVRGPADLIILAVPPSETSPPSTSPGDEATRPPRVWIKQASVGRTVTIVGTVTSRAGLIDPEGRRVTVQDRTGAILVRFPDDTDPPSVGRKIRATGEVDTWYGTRQLEAFVAPKTKRRARVIATGLRRPPTEEDEWRLVKVRAVITDVERDGDTWRAEAELRSGETLPIVGLAGSGIDPDRIEAGRAVRVTGIVRRAHPSASDQRFAIAPRSRKDVRLGAIVRDDDQEDGDDRDDDADDGDGAAIGRFEGGWSGGVPGVTLAALADLRDGYVRVGGRIAAATPRRLTIDDGTAQGIVRLRDTATAFAPAPAVGEVVNALGRVRARGNGAPEVVVRSRADVQRASALSPVVPPVSAEPVPPVGPVDDDALGSSPDVASRALRLDRLLLAPAVGFAIACAALLAIGGVLLRRSLGPVG